MVNALAIAGMAQTSTNVHVWVTGLEGPRGLTFGPDGALYVAEAGTGGKTSTSGICTQVVPPIGPYTGGKTGRISRIDRWGNRTTVASGFPSSADSMGDTSSVADVKFMSGTLYALIAGGGCSHGFADIPNGVAIVNPRGGSWKIIANLSEFVQTHPVEYPNPGDFEPDGTFYSMVPFAGKLYAVEPNHGQVISIGPNGAMQSVLDVSASEGHIVPTGITERNGDFYLGNLNLFPIVPGTARILTLSFAECGRLAAPGFREEGAPWSLHIVGSKSGFTTVVSTAFGPDGLLYALELSDAAGYPTPGDGKVVRVNHDGSIEDVATGLSVPTALTFGPDEKLYVSNFGAAPSGLGQIVKIDLP
jgi:hypothetical protein